MSLILSGRRQLREDTQVRKPAVYQYRNVFYVPDHEVLVVHFSNAALTGFVSCTLFQSIKGIFIADFNASEKC